MVLLTRAGRCTPSPAASTSECDLAGGQHRPCTSVFGRCHTGKSPRETATTSHQSEVGLEMRKTTSHLSISFEDGKLQLSATKACVFSSIEFLPPFAFSKNI